MESVGSAVCSVAGWSQVQIYLKPLRSDLDKLITHNCLQGRQQETTSLISPSSVGIHKISFILDISIAPLQGGATDTVRILCRSFTLKRHRQLRDLPEVPTWLLELDLNPRPSGRQVSTLPMSHHAQPIC